MENLAGSVALESIAGVQPLALRTESENEGDGAAEIETGIGTEIETVVEDARADDAADAPATAAIDGLAAGNELSDDELLQAITALIYALPAT